MSESIKPVIEPDPIRGSHWVDKEGIPGGGVTSGYGLCLIWQNGPVSAQGRNGASVEDVLLAAMDRLAFFQESALAAPPLADAIKRLHDVLDVLNGREPGSAGESDDNGKSIVHE